MKTDILSQRQIYRIKALCPHCELENCYLFPLDVDFQTREGLMASLAPVPAFCGKCHRRLIVPLLDLSGVKAEYEAYVLKVNEIAASGKTVMIAPVLGQDELDAHKFYGLNWDGLNIAFFLDMRAWWPNGVNFLSYPVLTLQDPHNVLRYKDSCFIILPCAEFEEILGCLRGNGIPPEKICYFDVDLPRRKGREVRPVLASLVRAAKSSGAIRTAWQNMGWLRKLLRPALDKLNNTTEMRK